MAQKEMYAFGMRKVCNITGKDRRIDILLHELNYKTLEKISTSKSNISFRDLYDYLNNKSKIITLNTKNIEYIENIKLSYCKENFNNLVNSNSKGNKYVCNDINSVYLKAYEYVCKHDKEKLPTRAIWDGEYPFIKYYIIRLGNENYEFITFKR